MEHFAVEFYLMAETVHFVYGVCGVCIPEGGRGGEREFISYVGHSVYGYPRAGQVAERVQFVYRVCGVCIL